MYVCRRRVYVNCNRDWHGAQSLCRWNCVSCFRLRPGWFLVTPRLAWPYGPCRGGRHAFSGQFRPGEEVLLLCWVWKDQGRTEPDQEYSRGCLSLWNQSIPPAGGGGGITPGTQPKRIPKSIEVLSQPAAVVGTEGSFWAPSRALTGCCSSPVGFPAALIDVIADCPPAAAAAAATPAPANIPGIAAQKAPSGENEQEAALTTRALRYEKRVGIAQLWVWQSPCLAQWFSNGGLTMIAPKRAGRQVRVNKRTIPIRIGRSGIIVFFRCAQQDCCWYSRKKGNYVDHISEISIQQQYFVPYVVRYLVYIIFYVINKFA